jgi:hypothetical protein
MKPDLHRSFTFWSGLLVMGFVCWAWWDSYSMAAYATFRHYYAESVHSGVTVIQRNTNSGIVAHYSTPEVSHPERTTFPTPFVLPAYDGDPPDRASVEVDLTLAKNTPSYHRALGHRFNWAILIPHWLILLAVAAVWLGLLFWRARRRTALSQM